MCHSYAHNVSYFSASSHGKLPEGRHLVLHPAKHGPWCSVTVYEVGAKNDSCPYSSNCFWGMWAIGHFLPSLP